MVKIYTAYDPPPAVESGSFEPSIVDQSELRELDIEVILERYVSRGIVPPRYRVGQFGDVSEAMSFAEMNERVAMGKEFFESMPAQVRTKFDNDPVKFMELVGAAESDPAVVEELKARGVVVEAPEEVKDVPVAPAVPPVG